MYDVTHLQIFQADQLRASTWLDPEGNEVVGKGRRALPRLLNAEAAVQANNGTTHDEPAGSIRIAHDGSVAAFVPAGRALSWQLLNPNGEPVVRERYWLTFQPGEIRVCGSCHGVNKYDQAGNPAKSQQPESVPVALDDLLRTWAGR